jgi:AcrR family transcriptional regulator
MRTIVPGAVAADQDRKAPGRPRSARADEAIIEAVLDLLAEGTAFEALSIEAVAARAGVGKATIYRRWSNKETLLVDAVATVKGDLPQIGGASVRDDLVALLRPFSVGQHSRAGKIMPCLLTELQRNAELNRCYQRISEPRRELMREVLRRGVREGVLRADIDLEIVMAMLVGPMVAQALTSWTNPDLDRDTLPERLVDAVWPAIAAG